jgi:FkbM family methyltransferase
LSALLNLARYFSTHPLTRDAPLKAWVRFVRWQLRSRLQDEVLFPWIAGQYLAVRRGMTGATGNIYCGLHEFIDMMVALHFLREGDLFLDIGANIGSYTVLASGVRRASTWAFEPDPKTVRYLKRNIAINHLDGLVTIYECALGSTRGEVQFTVGLDTVNKVVTSGNYNTRIVSQEKLDNIIDTISRPMMIKVDVEEYEEETLKGAQNVLANPFLKIIMVETITPWIESIMMQNNFLKTCYDPFSRALSKNGPQSSNFIYIRDLPFVETRLIQTEATEIFNLRI